MSKLLLRAADGARFDAESFTTSSASYANSRPVNGDMDVEGLRTKRLYIENTGSNSLDVRAIGQSNGLDTQIDARTLTGGQLLTLSEENPYQTIRVEVRPTVAGQNSTLRTHGEALAS